MDCKLEGMCFFNLLSNPTCFVMLIAICIPMKEVNSETEIMCSKFIRKHSRDQHLWRGRE